MTINYAKLIVYVVLVAINLGYGMSRHNKRIRFKGRIFSIDFGNFIAFLLLLFLLFLAITDNDNPDYYSYLSKYDGTSLYSRVTEVGYVYLIDFSKTYLGLSFFQFRLIILCFCALSLWRFFSALKVEKNAAFGFYAIFPFVYDEIQLRNYLAFCIILCFLPALFSGEKKGVAIFIAGVVLSFTIHYIGILYLVFILITFNKDEEKHIKKQRTLLITLGFSSLLVFAMKAFPAVGAIILKYVTFGMDDVRIHHYFRGIGNWGFLLFIGLEVLFIITAKYNKDLVVKECKESHYINMANNIFWIDLAVGCFFPLLLINTGFYRIFRNLLLINYSIPFLASICKQSNNRNKVYLLFALAFLTNCILVYNLDSVDVFLSFLN